MSELKNRARKMFSIDKQLVEKLEQLSKSTRIPQSRLIDEAIEDLVSKYRGEQAR
jgi:metal-responsive CopG/Arc/MetJ family transcriptional regulator